MKTEINDLKERLKNTEVAIGLILASLSKEAGIDLKTVFGAAVAQANELNLPGEVPSIIVKIMDAAHDRQKREPGIVVLDH